MRPLKKKCVVTLTLMLFGIGIAQEGSLQSALDAVDRRERSVNQLQKYQDIYNQGKPGSYYGPDDDTELSFLNSEPKIDTSLLDYGDYDTVEPLSHQDDSTQFSSSFRERIEKDNARQRDVLSKMLFKKLGYIPDFRDNAEKYIEALRLLNEKYRNSEMDKTSPIIFNAGDVSKRVYPFENQYYNLGYDSVGMKKRKQYFQSDGSSENLYTLDYAPKQEKLITGDRDITDRTINNEWNQHENEINTNMIPNLRPYTVKKRFPVAKRGYMQHKQFNRLRRNPPATDPKVVKELSTVFGVVKSKPSDKPKKSIVKPTKPKNTEHDLSHNKDVILIKNDSTKERVNDKRATTKEVVPYQPNIERFTVQKKSIDLSNYFGYDRKKKLNTDILMGRYHKAIAVATKRSAEYPLDTDELQKKDDTEEAKLEAIDAKLKNMEECIVDETLKFTGAHKDTTDSKIIQEVKDEVISRLAAAYSIEKMRRALDEYKQDIVRQKQHLKELEKSTERPIKEEKRVSVPRKHAINVERENTQDDDNNIKCTQAGGECEEEAYNPPHDVLGEEEEAGFSRGECPKIARACNDLAEVLGSCGRVLEPACNMYQICLFCGDNSWVSPTHHCNIQFLTRAYELCQGDMECERIASSSVTYLIEIKYSMKLEPSDQCDVCSDNSI